MRKDLSNTDLPFDLERRRIRALETLNILDTPKEELFDRHTRLIQRVLNTPIAWFSLIDENRVCYKSSQGILLDDTPRADSLCELALANDSLLVIEDTQAIPALANSNFVSKEHAFRFYAGRPIKDNQGYCLGVLAVVDFEPRKLASDEAELLEHIAELIEFDIHLAQQTTLDPLTGLSNLRGFENSACHIVALCDRSQCEATLVSFELIDLPGINATHGHEAGDLALNAFGKLLVETFRACDVISRVNSDRFIVLLSHGDNVDIHMPIRRFLIKLAEFNEAVQSPHMIDANISYLHYEKQAHGSINKLLAASDQHIQVNNAKLLNPTPETKEFIPS